MSKYSTIDNHPIFAICNSLVFSQKNKKMAGNVSVAVANSNQELQFEVVLTDGTTVRFFLSKEEAVKMLAHCMREYSLHGF